MCEAFNDTDIQQQLKIKFSLDPNSLLNPGKVYPILRKCAEKEEFMSTTEKQNFQTSQDFSSLSKFKPKSEKEIAEFVKFLPYLKNIPIEVIGSGSKVNIGRNFQSEKVLDLSEYSGIIKYEPEELYKR